MALLLAQPLNQTGFENNFSWSMTTFLFLARAIIVALAMIGITANSAAIPKTFAQGGLMLLLSQPRQDVYLIQSDITKLESDEKQIKIDLTQSETVVQGKGPQNLQNPSIQQSLEASKQQQPNVGTLATPPNVLKQYEADKAKLQADQNNYATHILALTFKGCLTADCSKIRTTSPVPEFLRWNLSQIKLESHLDCNTYAKKDKAGLQLITFIQSGNIFKDLQKLVSAQQKENTRKELVQRLQNKPFLDLERWRTSKSRFSNRWRLLL
jgi:hypothetical protein